jgi:hypothetical protein
MYFSGDSMGRSQNRRITGSRKSGERVTRGEYLRATLKACRNGRCCQDVALLEAAYAQYVNHPNAPWNKNRSGAGYK